MDKIFQSSFAYVGAVVASLLTANLDGFSKIATTIGIEKIALVVCALLTANVLYLIFAVSCSFAVVKRGLFILMNGEQESKLRGWEVFIRSARPAFTNLSWNVDNYYVAIFFFSIIMSSSFFFIYGFISSTQATAGWVNIYLAILFLAHFIPIWSSIQTWKLIRLCQTQIAHLASVPAQ